MRNAERDTHHQALKINLDPSCYGTLAEIGADQVVARWFFRVGTAAGTVAKRISAYIKYYRPAADSPHQLRDRLRQARPQGESFPTVCQL